MLRAALSQLVELCFPGRCCVCGAFFEGGGMWCEACDAKLDALTQAPACDLCAMALPTAGSPCPYCQRKGPRNYERIVRLTPFAEPTRHLVHQLKYHGKWTIGEALGDRLAARGDVAEVMAAADVVAAVPLHWRRRLARGFNQSEVIARRLARRFGLPFVRPVARVRFTPTQTMRHSREQRHENLRDAMAAVRPKLVAGKRVVVVDDVMTTGATLQAMARALRQAGAGEMRAVVVAAADPRGMERKEAENRL